ncbi:hypothetical protein LTR59_017012 [Friedmanniomyces endolithicus]|nr:hypothetical protein LTS09_017713 [Friedmanniomyces endolithicus]KAK0352338.1 hypothetical protein LTR94_021213 [Friedmanniomyces endolithicus]KAK0769465.1 hypothetical protein LTR59_017012 [Friedmanniomyces endolithicus]KAK0776043.1 hypothetical protein LTR38_015637 [Friedmanniomyces endolithicus]KAK0863738.1 hypothetical protein LTR87_016075 [Friedmanniomyces endolithicus]
MLDRKGRPIRQTSVQHTPTPAIPRAASRSRSQHATVKAARAKGPSHLKRSGDAIRASYTKFGLDARRLVIVAEAQLLNPLSPFMSSAAKARAELTERRMKMLCERRDEILACIPAAGDLETGCHGINVVVLWHIQNAVHAAERDDVPTAGKGTRILIQVGFAVGLHRLDVV